MMQRICAHCQHSNPMENHYCGQCGATLHALVPQGKNELVTYGRPTTQLKQISQTVAVSLLALAAEAGLAYLRRRLGSESMAVSRPKTNLPASQMPSPPTAVGLRVTEVHQNGRLIQRTVEKMAWWWRE
jgi:hypothetical protein